MAIRTNKVSEHFAEGKEVPSWHLWVGFCAYLFTLYLSVPAMSLECSLAASPSAATSQATADQETKPGVRGDLATVIQSGSTNTVGYNIVIHNNGSATVMTEGPTHALVPRREFPPGTIDTKELQRLLTQIGDVSRIPIGLCMKSASFGTTTKISYAGKVSGDLRCISRPASDGDEALLKPSEDLAALVRTILTQLRFDTRRVSPDP